MKGWLRASLSDAVAHLAHGHVESAKDGARDDVVADVEFSNLGDGGDRADVSIGETVPGGDLKPVLCGQYCCFAQTF